MKRLALAVRMARAQGAAPGKRRKIPMPRPGDVKAVELIYLADLMQYVKTVHRLARVHVWPLVPRLLEQAARDRGDAELRVDTYLDDLNRAIGNAAEALEREYPDDRLRRLAAEAARRVDRFSADTTSKQVKAVAGIDVTASVQNLPRRIQDFTADNVQLITKVSTNYMDGVRDTVIRNVRAGVRAESFKTEVIDELEGVSETRAALIARDQVNKFNGEVTRSRQGDLGVTRYVWRMSDDERVRGNPNGKYPKTRYSHWDREGQVFEWSSPPPDGHPGFAINCRCWAEPVLDDII